MEVQNIHHDIPDADHSCIFLVIPVILRNHAQTEILLDDQVEAVICPGKLGRNFRETENIF
jgi:hypothetical protein